MSKDKKIIKLDKDFYKGKKILDTEYYINQVGTVLYSYEPQNNEVHKTYVNDFGLVNLQVMEEIDQVNEPKEMSIIDILKEKNDIIIKIKPVCKTMNPSGYYVETNEQHLEIPHFNEYTNCIPFIETMKEIDKLDNLPLNEEDLVEYIYKELQERSPMISFLIHNLFWEESKSSIVNFLSFLGVVGFQDKHQDIFYLFKGQSEDKQGQGAGKGVIQQLLSKLFSGLVVGVNNSNYNKNFNSMLLNQKIVIFDEVSFKKLNYETIKNITGNENIIIEFKGKEPMSSRNVSSWLFFTNEYDLLDKLNQNDRRCILIEPNPINNSLETRVDSELNMDIETYIKELMNEISSFIYVIGLSSKIKPKKPQNLKSNSHIRYYTQKSKVIVDKIDFFKIFTNKEHTKKYVSFLSDMGIVEDQTGIEKYIYSSEDIQFFIENKTIYYEMVLEMYHICKKYNIGFFTKLPTPLKVWGMLKERLSSNFDYVSYTYEIKPTKKNKLSKKFSKSGLQDKDFVKNKKSKIKITNRTKKIYQEEIISLVKREEEGDIPF